MEVVDDVYEYYFSCSLLFVVVAEAACLPACTAADVCAFRTGMGEGDCARRFVEGDYW